MSTWILIAFIMVGNQQRQVVTITGFNNVNDCRAAYKALVEVTDGKDSGLIKGQCIKTDAI